MELLHALLAPESEVNAVSVELLEQAGIDQPLDEIWFDADREATWHLLHTIECSPDDYPESVRWLPELGRWACRRTGTDPANIAALARFLMEGGSTNRLNW